jgi:hypothetical protein
MLLHKRITLLSPDNWEDKNDAYYLRQYKKKMKYKTVLACCFSTCPETFHHWKVFASGPSGVCIEFDKAKLLDAVYEVEGIASRKVEYLLIKENVKRNVRDWPFLKRNAFHDEREFRIIYKDADVKKEFLSIPIELSCINKITVNPWVHKSLADSTITAIRKLLPSSRIIVHPSNLIENELWKQCIHAD